jgi:hypothetical protein
MNSFTRTITVDIITGAPPVARRVLGRRRELELAQVRIVTTSAGTRTASFGADESGTKIYAVQTPRWFLEQLERIVAAVDTDPTRIVFHGAIRMHVWLRSAQYELTAAPRVGFGDAAMIPSHVDVAEAGVLRVAGELVARTGPTGHLVERTYTARSAPQWLLAALTHQGV